MERSNYLPAAAVDTPLWAIAVRWTGRLLTDQCTDKPHTTGCTCTCQGKIGPRVPVKRERDRLVAAKSVGNAPRKGMAGGPGEQGTAGLSAFGWSKVENRRPADRMWINGTCVVTVEVPPQKLRRVLEAVSCNSRFLEYVTFDIVGHGLCA